MDERQKIAISEMVSDRTPRPLMGPMLTFDLAGEMASLREENVWRAHGHNARTLIKHSEFRLVLITLRAGRQVHERETTERIVFQMIEGRARLNVPTERVELHEAQLLSIDRHIPFAIEALDDCALLLWLGWSKN